MQPVRVSTTATNDAGSSPVPQIRSPWILGLCSVLFDVDKGQTLQDLWPLDCLSEEEKSAVAFHAFPDSLSMELYTRNAIRDSSFTFRIKRDPEVCTAAGEPEFLYGYVFCRQRQDESLRRGGEQVSVLVLATGPLSSALLPLSQAAGQAFFNEGPVALAMVYQQVLTWPPPVPGSRMCLPIGAGVINARLPHLCMLPPPQPTVDPATQASLSRRVSRTLSRTASGSPRVAALVAQLGQARSGSGELSPVWAAAADTAAAGAQQQEKQQQQQRTPDAGGSNEQPTAAAAGNGLGDKPVAAVAAADDDGGWAVVPKHPLKQQPQQEEQETQQQGVNRVGSTGSLTGLSLSASRSSSRLSRTDLTAASNSGSSSNPAAAAGNVSSSAVLVDAADVSSSGSGAWSEWLAATLGPQWREEQPFPELEPVLVLAPLLRDLWTLWQLVVTSQPLMVVGLNPGETSNAVAALASLIAPLAYAADFRPYFTIHDPDFVAMAAGQLPKRQRYHEVIQQQPQQQQQEQPQEAQQPSQQSSQKQQQEQQAAVVSEATSNDAVSPQADALQSQQEQEQQQPSQQQQPPSQQPAEQQQQQPKAASQKQFNLPALIGVTNLYFVKALPKWPNVVAVSRKEVPATLASNSSRSGSPAKPPAGSGAATAAAAGSSSSPAAPNAAAEPAAAAGAGAASSSPAGSPAAPPIAATRATGSGGFFSSTAAAAVRAIQRRHQGPQHLLSHFSPHLWTCGRHVQCVKPDHALLSKARTAIEPLLGSSNSSNNSSSGSVGSGSAAGAAALRLRRHFADLTAGLLAPFEVYFRPGPSGKVPAWRPESFLASLDASSLHPSLTARLSGNAATSARVLYGAFIESPNFAFYFAQRRAPVLHLVEEVPDSEDEDQAYAQVGHDGGDSSPDALGVESDPDEVELVQQLLSTEQALMDAQQGQQGGGSTGSEGLSDAQQKKQEQALQLQFAQTFRQLPPDLQATLFSSPARQQLLQEAAAALAAGSCEEQEAAAGVLHRMQVLLIKADAEAAGDS